MIKQRKKRVFRILLIVLAAGVLICILISCSGVRIAGRSKQCLDEYTEHYFYKTEYKPLVNFNFGANVENGDKVWFLPGQKRKMLKKIKEDVNVELSDLVENNNDLLENYKINDDFRKIHLYYRKGKKEERGNRFDGFVSRVETKVELYHQLIHGFVDTSFDSYIIYEVE